MKRICMAVLGVALGTSVALAASENPLHLSNRIRVGYDDNIYRVDKDYQGGKTDSLRIIEEIDALLNLNYGTTHLALRYRPSVTWVEARDDDNFDVLHDVSFNFSHDISESLTLNLADTLRAGQMPELHEDDYVVREDNDNYYNSAVAALLYEVGPNTRIDLSGRFISLTYTSDSPAKDYSDYISAVGGLTLRQQLNPVAAAMADFRYQMLSYDKNPVGFDRDAQMFFGGLGYEQTFSRHFLGSLRGGVEHRMYDEDDYDDMTEPYVEASITFLPVEEFRTTLSASYSIYESDIANYMSQERLYLSASLAWDITHLLSAYAACNYSRNDYDADYAAQGEAGAKDGTENTFAASARLSWQVATRNWFEVGYQFTKLDSDIPGRQEYSDNRVDLGWRIQLF